jgi:hypothetical protein
VSAMVLHCAVPPVIVAEKLGKMLSLDTHTRTRTHVASHVCCESLSDAPWMLETTILLV